jgi:tetratricopeptide (TPR) repeat protein
LPVEVLAPADAAGFLLTRTKQSGPHAEAAATTLAGTLGGLPLALEQAGAFITASGTITLAGYAELFATQARELLRRGQPVGYQHTVATTWSLALETLQHTVPAAVGLLTLAAFLAPDDLPQPLLAAHAEVLPEPLAAADQLTLADAVAALRRYSLIRVIGDGLFVHRLLQTVVRAELDADAERAWASAAVQLVDAGFPYPSDQVATWPECERLLPHALAAAEHSQCLDVELEACLLLLSEAGLYLRSRGQYQPACKLHEQALAGRRRVLGDDHPDTLSSMNNLAVDRRILGDLQGARDLHEQALAALSRVLGDDHPDTLSSINNLALTIQALGDLQGARDRLEQALAGRRRVLGHDHPATLRSMNSLGEVRRILGDLQGARDLLEQTLAICRRVLGDDHPTALFSVSHLGLTRRDLGDLPGARELHEQALDARRRVLGNDHPNTLQSMNNLAETLRDLGDLADARDLHEQTLDARRRVLGNDHPDTLTSMNNLAAVYCELSEL